MDERIELVEAAARLKVSYHLAHRWALIGKLVAERVGGRWFVLSSSVERLLAEGKPVVKSRPTRSSAA